ncbi:MAG: DUF4037 domain-containing protein [Spirochaetales bacterium]|nr:DUF4037 domain-containing protein [Spirochaetales bacterium]
MRRKVKLITEDLANRLVEWGCVDTVVLASDIDLDVTDPYFHISLDAYYREDLPDPEVRHQTFIDAGAFESSAYGKKDRFLIDTIPVRIEYKQMDRIETILDFNKENLMVFRQTGTYIFYRLQKGQVLMQRSNWIKEIRERLENMPENFWQKLRDGSQATIEHYFEDFQNAVLRNDLYFTLISQAGFLKSFTSMLFVINQQFEPSGRQLYRQVYNLPILPENFKGRFETFIREDQEFPPSRKREVAELLVRSIIFLK